MTGYSLVDFHQHLVKVIQEKLDSGGPCPPVSRHGPLSMSLAQRIKSDQLATSSCWGQHKGTRATQRVTTRVASVLENEAIFQCQCREEGKISDFYRVALTDGQSVPSLRRKYSVRSLCRSGSYRRLRLSA